MTQPWLVVCMGVSGCGKSTLGQRIASREGALFLDADDFHCAENRARLNRGQALTDTQRGPWMDAIEKELARHLGGDRCIVLAHSALRRELRDRLRRCYPRVFFAYLAGSFELISGRLAARQGHFASPEILPSQFATLEPPHCEPGVLTLDVATAPDVLEAQLCASIQTWTRESLLA